MQSADIRLEVVVSSVSGSVDNRFARCYTRDRDDSLKDEEITFSIHPDVWKGGSEPKRGEVVILSDVRTFRKGLRAFSAEPKPVTSQKSGGPQ